MFILLQRLSYALPLILFDFFYPQQKVIEGVPSKKKKNGRIQCKWHLCVCRLKFQSIK